MQDYFIHLGRQVRLTLRGKRHPLLLLAIVFICSLAGCGDSSETFVVTGGNVNPAISFKAIIATPNPSNLTPNSTQQLAVRAQTTNNFELDVTAQSEFVLNQNSAPGISVSDQGLVTVSAQANPGDTAEVAVSWLASNSAQPLTTTVQIIVATSDATLTQLIITPSSPVLSLGRSQNFTVNGVFSDGSVQDVSNQVTWTSSQPSVALPPNNGATTALAVGQTQLEASIGNIQATTTLTVTGAVLQSLEIQGGDTLGAPGGSRQFVALGTFSDGSVFDLTSQVTWSSNNPVLTVFNGPQLTPDGRGAGFARVATTANAGTTVVLTVNDPATAQTATINFVIGSFLIVNNSNDNSIMSFLVDTVTGALTFIEEEPVGTFPLGLTVSPTGKFVYSANLNSANLSGFEIEPLTGQITELANSPFATESGPYLPAFDRTGRFIFVPNANEPSLTMYEVDQDTGDLSVIQTLPDTSFANAPIDVEVHPRLPLIYVTNILDAAISVFRFDENGMTEIAGSPFTLPTRNGANQVDIEPNGEFLYLSVANNFNPPMPNPPVGQIFGFSIDQETGELTELSGSPYPTDTFPQFIVSHPTGPFLYVGNITGSITVYDRDVLNGDLSLTQTVPTIEPGASASSPREMVIDPAGRFLYFPNQSDLNPDVIQIYAIDGTTGLLTRQGTAQVGDNPFGLGLTP